MLNLFDPKTNAIFQASVYLDQLKNHGHQLMVATENQRLEPAFK